MALQELAKKRHTILHNGGWFQSEEKRKGKFAPMLRLEFAEADIRSALDLALRCTRSVVSQYRKFLVDRAQGSEHLTPDLKTEDGT